MSNEISYYALPCLYAQGMKHKIAVGAVPPSSVIKAIEKRYGVTLRQLQSKSREPELTFIRHLAIAIVNHKCKLSLKTTGEVFNRDHTSVIHAKKAVQNRFDTNYRREEIDYFFNYDY